MAGDDGRVFCGEVVDAPARVVVATAHGEFIPTDALITEHPVQIGDTVGLIRCRGTLVHVDSPFSGVFREFLVAATQRVRPGQPVAWLTPPTG